MSGNIFQGSHTEHCWRSSKCIKTLDLLGFPT
jgi:hypothetical protein